MAHGEAFKVHGATIAHRHLPFSTRVELENPRTGQRVRAVLAEPCPNA